MAVPSEQRGKKSATSLVVCGGAAAVGGIVLAVSAHSAGLKAVALPMSILGLSLALYSTVKLRLWLRDMHRWSHRVFRRRQGSM